ncbi:MAG: DUF4258 domain-containing protein [Candidatus Aenigmarchaeota archaeon]|nr:DUF4258 domain-containing protein [Candidatus Aenigmarchaeota archaeon]
MKKDKKFKVATQLKILVSVTNEYWDYITTIKHPHIRSKENEIINTLKNPEIIRQSKRDKNVYLFYRKTIYYSKQYYLCVIINKEKGFVITAYITDKIKEGEEIWKK